MNGNKKGQNHGQVASNLCSGGFGISMPGQVTIPLGDRVLGRSRVGEGGKVVVPLEVGASPGDRPLAVRGSRHALGFVARGPIYETALEHPELEAF